MLPCAQKEVNIFGCMLGKQNGQIIQQWYYVTAFIKTFKNLGSVTWNQEIKWLIRISVKLNTISAWYGKVLNYISCCFKCENFWWAITNSK